jgi:hypothetical protein
LGDLVQSRLAEVQLRGAEIRVTHGVLGDLEARMAGYVVAIGVPERVGADISWNAGSGGHLLHEPPNRLERGWGGGVVASLAVQAGVAEALGWNDVFVVRHVLGYLGPDWL